MAEEKQELKHFIRVANTDLRGDKQILFALRKIKGVSHAFANAVLHLAKVSKTIKAGSLNDAQIQDIEKVLKNPTDIPLWMYNRRKDLEEGNDRHLLTVDLDYTKDNDIKLMKKMKTYKGVRHAVGLPVRGQRTRSNFRRGKALGVQRKKGKGGRV